MGNYWLLILRFINGGCGSSYYITLFCLLFLLNLNWEYILCQSQNRTTNQQQSISGTFGVFLFFLFHLLSPLFSLLSFTSPHSYSPHSSAFIFPFYEPCEINEFHDRTASGILTLLPYSISHSHFVFCYFLKKFDQFMAVLLFLKTTFQCCLLLFYKILFSKRQ